MHHMDLKLSRRLLCLSVHLGGIMDGVDRQPQDACSCSTAAALQCSCRPLLSMQNSDTLRVKGAWHTPCPEAPKACTRSKSLQQRCLTWYSADKNIKLVYV